MATEILRPNAAGDEENISGVTGNGVGTHWVAVDEVEADDDTSYVSNYNIAHQRDLYNSADHSVGSGTINHIIVHARSKASPAGNGQKIAIKSGTGAGAPDTVDEDAEEALTTSWANYSHQWGTNPATSAAWTWDEIDKLQIGISIGGGEKSYRTCYCTQVYVEVDYTAANVLVTPTTLALSDTQFVPIIKWGIIPPILSLSDTQYAPVIKHKVIVPVLALSDTEYAPVLHLKIIPPLLALSDTQYIPVVAIDRELVPSTLALTLTTFIPPIWTRVLATPTTLSLSDTEYAPTIGFVYTPSTLALTITLYTPVYGGGVVPTTLSLSDTEFAPTIKHKIIIPLLALSDTEYAPVIGWGIVPATLALSDTEFIPVIGWGIIPPVLALSDTEYAPIIKHKIIIPLETLSLSLFAPDSIYGVIVAGALGYTIEIRNSAGELLAIIENAFGISLTEQLNRPPMLDFRLPSDDSKISNIDPDNEVWLRDYETGTLLNKFLIGRRRDVRS